MKEATLNKLKIVEEWHKALNNKDKKRMCELVKENVKIGGPKGETEGVNIMLEWMDRALISLTPKRYFLSDKRILVEEQAEWHRPGTDEVLSSQIVASVFVVENNFITSIYRYEDLEKAFEKTGLSEKDSL